ncbi:hypothetical protein AB0A76_30985 [Streptomyces exfoliatus]|uniref:Uncharacterized protein n=1 Tax=Streptomyces exfoliatus TaxID=1905 RepID=A0ABV3D519_STREX
MTRYRQTGGVALRAMVLGGDHGHRLHPAQDDGAVPPADAVGYAREVRAAVATGR